MNKTVKTISIAGSLILCCLAIMFVIFFERDTGHPKRLPNIPENAVWKGAADEGFWFELINIDSQRKAYHFKIYNDDNGKLAVEANFIASDSCKYAYPLDKHILDEISYFEFDKIVTVHSCNLVMRH